MPVRRYRKKRVAKRKPRYARRMRPMTSLSNPQPVFTETFRHSVVTLAGGFASTVLGASMDSINQLSQYSNLYQRYRILRCSWLILPQATSYDVTTVPFSNNYQLCPRVVYAINDTSPNVSTGPVAPPNEQAMLQQNGCKIRMGDRPIRFTNRPVPQLIDQPNQTTVVVDQRRKWITFPLGPNVTHWGIAMTFSNTGVFNAPATVEPSFVVYCKLTFQLADPR